MTRSDGEDDDPNINRQCAGIIAQYWARQGVAIEVVGGQGKLLRSNLGANGLPASYEGQDEIPISTLQAR